MQAGTKDCVVLVLALSVLPACAASAGGGHGGSSAGGWGAVHRFGGAGFRGGYRAGFAGSLGGAPRYGTGRGLPPVAGVIHEGPAGHPYFSAYGHTNTGARFGGFDRGGVPGYGRHGGYGHLGTGLRYGGLRRRFVGGRGFLGGLGGGFGAGYGVGSGAYGGYGSPGVYGEPGSYGEQGTYGQPGTYGGQGAYGTTATQGVYGSGGFAYRSETPLAVRFAEPPLGPSPYAPYSPDDRYAYAASADVFPRVVNPYRTGSAGCACGPRREPTIYRYGVGTAY